MGTPGFTAEASVAPTHGVYRASSRSDMSSASIVAAQAPPGGFGPILGWCCCSILDLFSRGGSARLSAAGPGIYDSTYSTSSAGSLARLGWLGPTFNLGFIKCTRCPEGSAGPCSCSCTGMNPCCKCPYPGSTVEVCA